MNDPILIHRTLRIPRCHPRLWLALLVALLVDPAARAALIFDLPDLNLQPNTAGQTFTISVQNTGSSVDVNGVQLNLVVADGGPLAGGTVLGPAIQGMSLTALGLLFYGNNNGELGAGSIVPQVFQRSTSTIGTTVISLGSGFTDLVTVTLDTSGFGPGLYSWSASSSPNGISYWTDTSYPPAIGDVSFPGGTLTVVPEPVNVALPIFGGLAVLIGGLRRWCRRSECLLRTGLRPQLNRKARPDAGTSPPRHRRISSQPT